MLNPIKKLLAATIFVGLFYLGWSQSKDIDWTRMWYAPEWAIASLLFCFCTIALNFNVWHRLLNRNSNWLTTPNAYKLYAIASLSRYLPGGQLWQYASLIRFSETPEAKVESTTAHFFATLSGLAAGFLLLLLNLTSIDLTGNEFALCLSALFLGIVLFAFCHPRMRSHLSHLLHWISLGKLNKIPPIAVRHFAMAIVQSTLSWGVTCLSYLALFSLLGEAPSVDLLSYIMASYAIATLGAYISFITPAGLGVREGIFAALLSVKIALPEAVFVSLAGGLSLFLAECLFLVPFLVSHLLRVKRVSSPS